MKEKIHIRPVEAPLFPRESALFPLRKSDNSSFLGEIWRARRTDDFSSSAFYFASAEFILSAKTTHSGWIWSKTYLIYLPKIMALGQTASPSAFL